MGGKSRKIAANARRETREQRSVSFTKRRQGLFNKAAELCLFHGAQVAIVVSSPCSVNNLYSFGHSSTDAVFDAFLQGRQPDDNAQSAEAVSLYKEIKALERKPDDEGRKRKRKSGQILSDEFWREIEVFEKDCESVEELQALVNNLEKFKEKALNRLVTSIMSQSDSPSSSNLSNSADDKNFAGLDENFGAITKCNEVKDMETVSGFEYTHVDENCAFSDSEVIDFAQNFVDDGYNNAVEVQAGCGMVTDSTSDILDSFTVDDECYNEDFFGSFLNISPYLDQTPVTQPHHKHSTCEAATVSESGPLISWVDQLISYDDDHQI